LRLWLTRKHMKKDKQNWILELVSPEVQNTTFLLLNDHSFGGIFSKDPLPSQRNVLLYTENLVPKKCILLYVDSERCWLYDMNKNLKTSLNFITSSSCLSSHLDKFCTQFTFAHSKVLVSIKANKINIYRLTGSPPY
jgi:hypothetical protein